MPKRRLTVYDIAREAGVSASTVSRVLTGNVPVRERTRMRVLDVLERHDFRPSSVARSLKARKSRTIGFIVPDITNPYFSQLFLEFEVRAADAGYTVMLCNSHSIVERESQILDMLMSKDVEGIVFCGGRVDDMLLTKKYIREMNRVNASMPLITCSALPGVECFQIINNDEKAIYELVGHIADLGHRTLGVIGGRLMKRPSFERRRLILQAAEEHDMTIRREWLVEGGFDIPAGLDCMDRLLQSDELPTAVFCFNDVVAVGALASVLRHGLRVPDDVALVGFDGIDLTEEVYPGITTAVTDFGRYGELIIDLIQRGESSTGASEAVLDLTVAMRESTVGAGGLRSVAPARKSERFDSCRKRSYNPGQRCELSVAHCL